jgi:hypothetical protein
MSDTGRKVGIIGSGVVGRTLADGFIKHGYRVTIGTRDRSKLEDWKAAAGERGQVGSFEDAAAFGDLVVLACMGRAAEDVVRQAGPANLSGKPVLDATNPIAEAAPEDGVLGYFTGPNASLMERLQALAPDAGFVKAFSCVGSALMVDPDLPGGPPTMFICGDSAAAKARAREVLEQFGWETMDLGTAKAARAIEPLAILWCIPGFRENDWVHALKMLRPASR